MLLKWGADPPVRGDPSNTHAGSSTPDKTMKRHDVVLKIPEGGLGAKEADTDGPCPSAHPGPNGLGRSPCGIKGTKDLTGNP